MRRMDIKIKLNHKLWKRMKDKIKNDFDRSYCDTYCLLIIILLSLYKRKDRDRCGENLYLVLDNSADLSEDNYYLKTISIYGELLDYMKAQYPDLTYSQLVERAIVDFLYLPTKFYTDCISPLYTIVGSKNHTIQKATANAVDDMKLSHKEMTLIDGYCATGSLFFGLKTYEWEKVILNDMNPLRTNFLNVIKNEPLKLIKMILDTDLSSIEQPDSKNEKLRIFKAATNTYVEKRKNYKRVDCNAEIAYYMFLQQCIDKAMIERSDRIFERLLSFLPACLKLQNAIITQNDCLTYLKNDTAKLVLLDVPYIGSEKECSVKSYRYDTFHSKVAKLLHLAGYPFL